MEGYGYPTRSVSAPSSGLYYMWVYFSGNNVKNVYGYILVDNLEEDIALESITIQKTATVEMGKNLTINPTFSPRNATNKIVSWISSDETVATVSNAGEVTPKKVGSTIITVTSQDGNKKATCTVTVTEASNNNENNNNNNDSNNNSENNDNSGNQTGTTNKNDSSKTKDTTTIKGVLPKTGVSMGFTLGTLLIFIGAVIFYKKYNI